MKYYRWLYALVRIAETLGMTGTESTENLLTRDLNLELMTTATPSPTPLCPLHSYTGSTNIERDFADLMELDATVP